MDNNTNRHYQKQITPIFHAIIVVFIALDIFALGWMLSDLLK